MNARAFWKAVVEQDAEKIRGCFLPTAYINWHCTNERFTAEEFIRVNCDYPGRWRGEVERVEQAGDLTITVTRVFPAEGGASFHAVSFIRVRDGKIAAMDEYWGDDGPAPQWRLEMRVGTAIR